MEEMTRDIAKKLKAAASSAAYKFSQDRECNPNKEVFNVDQIIPLSSATAAVICLKNTGKKALIFFYCLKKDKPSAYWEYFFPTESHLLGMKKLERFLHNIEQHNFPLNEGAS
jgi:hypothetical protein